MSARKKRRTTFNGVCFSDKKQSLLSRRDKAKVLGTKYSSRIAFSPETNSHNDYITPQMNQILTLPRAPAKPFKRRLQEATASKHKRTQIRRRQSKYPPQPLLLGTYADQKDIRDDIDKDIDNIMYNDGAQRKNHRSRSYLSTKFFSHDDEAIDDGDRTNSFNNNRMMKMTHSQSNMNRIPSDAVMSNDFSLKMNGFKTFENYRFNYERNINALLKRANDGTKKDAMCSNDKTCDAGSKTYSGTPSQNKSNHTHRDTNHVGNGARGNTFSLNNGGNVATSCSFSRHDIGKQCGDRSFMERGVDKAERKIQLSKPMAENIDDSTFALKQPKWIDESPPISPNRHEQLILQTNHASSPSSIFAEKRLTNTNTSTATDDISAAQEEQNRNNADTDKQHSNHRNLFVKLFGDED